MWTSHGKGGGYYELSFAPRILDTSPDVPGRFLVTNDSTYIEYLISTFELLWNRAVPAAQRIEELLKEGPPQA